jgi:hypothetical protein
MLYWHRLEKLWYTPEIWNEDYGWDLGWVAAPVVSVNDWVKDEVEHLHLRH